MTLNVELLDRTLAHIEANRDQWVQATYRCQTGMCFAGWAATLAGGRWLRPEIDWDAFLVAEEDDPDEDTQPCAGGPGVQAHERARRVLGLGYDTADDLFRAGNDIDDLRRIVAELKVAAQ